MQYSSDTIAGRRFKDLKWGWSAFWFMSALVFWVAPMAYTGTKQGFVKWLPLRWTQQHAVSALFTNRQKSWAHPGIMIKTAGAAQWSGLPMTTISPLSAAGYRQRLDRLLTETNRKAALDSVCVRLSEYVRHHYSDAYPSQPLFSEVRIVRTVWATGTPELAYPAAHWSIPPLEMVSPKQIAVLSAFTLSPSGRPQPLAAGGFPPTGNRAAGVTPRSPPRTVPSAVIRRNLPNPEGVRAMIQSQLPPSVPQDSAPQQPPHVTPRPPVSSVIRRPLLQPPIPPNVSPSPKIDSK